MNKLKIKYFKAFKDELSLEFEGNNLLLYGENGAGKSSIYEALKIVFFKNRFEQNIPKAQTREEQNQNEEDFWDKYNNKTTNKDFVIEIDDVNSNSFSIENHQVFMISLFETTIEDKLYLNSLLKKFYFDIPGKIDNFCEDYYDTIEESVNDALENFHENVKIKIDIEDNFAIKITDSKRNLTRKDDIKKYFNEAKLNLILLLLLFDSIRCAKALDKQQVIVLDDFITSLDISNRTFLIKYILDNFSEFQILIFTHNVNFYNLTMYLINTIYNITEKWIFANLYEINGSNKLYFKDSNLTTEKIIDEFNENLSSEQLEGIGNKIRQKFEVLLYEFSKLLMIGSVEESNKILERIELQKNLYYKNSQNASDLVDEILKLTDSPPPTHNLQQRIRSKINQYKQSDLLEFQKTLKQMKLYRKVTLHPMSHGSIGQNPFTIKEIKTSLILLKKLEASIGKFVNKNVSKV